MGLGDQLIATGLAKGAAARGRRIAFGNGHKIFWDHNSELIFRGNPNVAAPGSEGARDLEWIGYHKGSRIYNHHDRANNRWVWNESFRCIHGEVYFTDEEKAAGLRHGTGFVLIEPNVEGWKSVAPNKDWGRDKYQRVADALNSAGHSVAQFVYEGGGPVLGGVKPIKTRDFRDALSILANASLYVGPEGGLHHGAAAVGIPAVVIFGGFIPPSVTGYDTHTNFAFGKACGSLSPCQHCRGALEAIRAEDVTAAALNHLVKKAA